MIKAGHMLTALAAFAAWPAAALAPVAPAPEALVERYMASLPQTKDRIAAGRAEYEMSRLMRVNPGAREADLRAAVDAWQACSMPVMFANTDGAIRATVRAMGAAKVTQLISFYSGRDHDVFGAILEAGQHGALTQAQQTERQRIYDTYPLAEFGENFRAELERARAEEAFVRDVNRCTGIEERMLAQHGLRRE